LEDEGITKNKSFSVVPTSQSYFDERRGKEKLEWAYNMLFL
jgi:hypothetical protein